LELSSTINITNSSWELCGALRLFISKYINSNLYINLDSKHHFISNITKELFIENKPNMYLGNPGNMIKNHINSLKYFNINCPFNHKYIYDMSKPFYSVYTKDTNCLLTTMPYIFITSIVKDLISYIENRENKHFLDFYLSYNNPKMWIENRFINEPYLYSGYLIYTDKLKCYNLTPMIKTIESWDDDEWSRYNLSNDTLTNAINNNYKIISLHRKSINRINYECKHNLLNFYKKVYNNKLYELISNNIIKL